MACSTPEAALGIATKLGFVTSNPGSPPTNPTEQLEIDSESIALRQMRENVSGIRGTRAEAGNRTIDVRRMVEGGFTCRPTPLDVEAWLPRIMGGSYSGSAGTLRSIQLAESTGCFDVFKLIHGKGFKYRECKVQGAVFRGSEGGVLSMSVDVIGRDRDAIASYTWPGGVSFTDGKPWAFSKVSLEIPAAGTTYRLFDFGLSIQNQYEPRFANSETITDLVTTGRQVSLGLNLPWGTSETLLTTFSGNGSGLLLRATYGSGADERTLEFETALAQAMDLTDPAVPGKGEIKWDLALNFKYVPPASPDTQMTARIKTS